MYKSHNHTVLIIYLGFVKNNSFTSLEKSSKHSDIPLFNASTTAFFIINDILLSEIEANNTESEGLFIDKVGLPNKKSEKRLK